MASIGSVLGIVDGIKRGIKGSKIWFCTLNRGKEKSQVGKMYLPCILPTKVSIETMQRATLNP